jgi:hypothetical protein
MNSGNIIDEVQNIQLGKFFMIAHSNASGKLFGA